MSNKRISGACYIKVDGEQLSLSGSLTCLANSVVREAVMGSTGVAGFSENPVAPTITGTFNVGAEFPLEKVTSSTAMTVTAELANGMVFTLSDAFVSGEVSYSASDGTVQLTFTGVRGSWS